MPDVTVREVIEIQETFAARDRLIEQAKATQPRQYGATGARRARRP
jgi:ribosomal protein S9